MRGRARAAGVELPLATEAAFALGSPGGALAIALLVAFAAAPTWLAPLDGPDLRRWNVLLVAQAALGSLVLAATFGLPYVNLLKQPRGRRSSTQRITRLASRRGRVARAPSPPSPAR